MASITFDDKRAIAAESEVSRENSADNGARLRVGLFAIGLEAYWDQFEGLQERLTGYAGQVAQRLHPGCALSSRPAQ
jgi:hypothetical protein